MSKKKSKRRKAPAPRGAKRQNNARTPKTLRQINPGGSLYQDWCYVPADVLEPEAWAEELTRIGPDEAELMAVMPYFAGIYGEHIPIVAAMILDGCIQEDSLYLLRDDGPDSGFIDEVRPMGVGELAERAGPELEEDGKTIRDTLHWLHAKGLLIMEADNVVAMGTPWYMKERKRRLLTGALS